MILSLPIENSLLVLVLILKRSNIDEMIGNFLSRICYNIKPITSKIQVFSCILRALTCLSSGSSLVEVIPVLKEKLFLYEKIIEIIVCLCLVFTLVRMDCLERRENR